MILSYLYLRTKTKTGGGCQCYCQLFVNDTNVFDIFIRTFQKIDLK